jgi:hypothetical protein
MKMPATVILAMSALDCARSEDFIAWAVDEMVAGRYSDALAVLAGFDESVSSFELREYFQKAKRELGLSEPTKPEAIQCYSTHLAQSVLEPGSDYRPIVTKLSALCYSNDYPSHLMEWYELEDGLCDIESMKNYPFAYEALYQADPRAVVEDVARRFLQSEQGGGGNSATLRASP